ncbi:hypothetical protein [Stenotrophomonas acidaminiphila]|uniref:hypothetical protein n=1 Tax=Stenotrophomonas acidaminiphila TaxID=128780 RepID=UPI001FAF9199|nr:hypothetical protein [Stenotrophomonas acidaminiphila]
MINPDALRAYHRQLCLHIMQIGGAQTAAEVHEAMTSASLSVGHPKQCAEITPAAVAGLLRSLHGEQLVAQGASKPNSRYGRPEPTWRPQPELEHMVPVPFPNAPGTKPASAPATALSAPTGAPVADDPSALSREHAVLLMVGDALSTATARFMAEVEEIKSRARAMLVNGSSR